MSDHRRPTPLRRRTVRSAALSRSALRELALYPMLAAGAAAGAGLGVHSTAQLSLGLTLPCIGAAWFGCAWYGVQRADAAHKASDAHLETLVVGIEELRAVIAEAVSRVEAGELYSPPEVPLGDLSADPGIALEQLLLHARAEAEQAIGRAAQLQQQSMRNERVQTDLVWAIARRQNSLVSRTLEALDLAERSIEDPDILYGLFRIDNLVTQQRRYSQNVEVLIGQNLAGNAREPLAVSSALRQAVEVIERYDRVRRPTAPSGLSFPGHIGPNVVHLVAELLENATRFSDSRTSVELTATLDQHGLVIAVRDRGISMPAGSIAQLNEQLASPQTVDVYARLREGRIGLVVTGQLAQRSGIHVQLQANTDGPGLTAFAVVPSPLLLSSPTHWAPPRTRQPAVETPQVGLPHPAHIRLADAPEATSEPHRSRTHAHGSVSSTPSPAEAPTEGRVPLPVRPAAVRLPSSAASAPPADRKGPTPGLFGQFRDGTQGKNTEHTGT